jgi:ribonuclease-3
MVLAEFQSRIDITFNDTALLEQALTHSSYVNESPDPTPDLDDNQRLEFLGDAILDFLVGEWLYRRYPDAREGELTSLRAHLVRTESLAAFAATLIWRRSAHGKGEAASGGARRPANLCAAFEALVGAIYLDQGYATARGWVAHILDDHRQEIDLCRQAKTPRAGYRNIPRARCA